MSSPGAVISGVGVVCAAGEGTEALWQATCAARPLARIATRYPTGDLRTRSCNELPAALDAQIAARWPGRPRSVALAAHVATQALGGGAASPGLGLFLGTSLGCTDAWEPWHAAIARGQEPPEVPPGIGHGGTALLLAETLQLSGPVTTISTACTSAAVALILAAEAICCGELDEALVIGVDVLSRFVHAGFDSLKALTPDTLAPAPFADDREGLWLGEAAAAVWLTRGQQGLARVLGGATAGDGVHMTAPDRHARGMQRAIRAALRHAQRAPSDIDWISAHATGTRYNDAMEAHAFAAVFDGHPPAVHGLKPIIGHTLGASGLVEIILATEVLARGVRPPTHTRALSDPELPSPPIDRVATAAQVRTILSTNAAFAGHNSAVVVGL